MLLDVGTRLGHYAVTAMNWAKAGWERCGKPPTPNCDTPYHRRSRPEPADRTDISAQVALKTAGGVSGFFARFITLTPELRLSVGNSLFMYTLSGGVR